jgi:nucleoid-associated protein YgaU
VDGSLVREVSVSADGRWAMELRDLAEGRYRLRIDQIGADGRVASRVETPFQRDFPAAPRPRPGVAGPGVNVTVQPGGTLWTIARTQYGSGVLYAQIFTANSELIRDPDLIYPGQVLAIPGLDQPE